MFSSSPMILPKPILIILSLSCLIIQPCAFYGYIPGSTPLEFLKAIQTAWDALLHFSVYPIMIVTLCFACYLCSSRHRRRLEQAQEGIRMRRYEYVLCTSANRVTLAIIVCFAILILVSSQLQVLIPSWLWNPFLWGRYTVYQPKDLNSALVSLCLDDDTKLTQEAKQPLCLSNRQWKTLSSGALSSKNREDVSAVHRGVVYARDKSGGLVVNVLARDTMEAIEPLRHNVEALSKFFPKLSVVVFESDSIDGTREAIQQWADEVNPSSSYTVDLIQCGDDAPNCKFGQRNRNDFTSNEDSTTTTLSTSSTTERFFHTSAVGSMANLRNRILNHILSTPTYDSYSHMLIIDLDLGISLSPLGILHTLGHKPDHTVSSSGRQVYLGSLGSLIPPYDFSAFRPHVTPQNRRLVKMHEWFCGLMPLGDRWRNQCDSVSPMHFLQVLLLDRSQQSHSNPNKEDDDEYFYRVISTFNGATLYPLHLIRNTNPNPKYDTGEDGQRCEHVGFHLSLQTNNNRPMYVNRKWDMHISPIQPAGLTGKNALNNSARTTVNPKFACIIMLIVIQNVGALILFVYSIMILGLYGLCPICVWLLDYFGGYVRRWFWWCRVCKSVTVRGGLPLVDAKKS